MKTKRFVSSLDLFSVPLEKLADGGPVTLRVPVLPKGTFQHQVYGELDWTDARFDQMIANFDEQVTGYAPMLNADHASHNPFAASAPAYGWLKSLDKDSAGLWATVELTDLGEEAIQQRRYRYFSAEVADEYERSTGDTAEDVITGLALTNTPFHDTMPGLFAALPTADAIRQFAMATGELSFGDIREMLSDALCAQFESDPDRGAWVEEVFPDFFIYEVWSYYPSYRETHYKRSYSIVDGQVQFGDDAVEVEEVWMEKARQAFRTATRGISLARKGQGAPESSGSRSAGVKLAQRSTMLLEFCRKLFGLPESATEGEVAVALAAAKPAASPEPATPAAKDAAQFAAPAGKTLVDEADLRQFRRQAEELETLRREKGEAEKALAQKSADDMVAGYVEAGKLAPAQREAALEFALRDPVLFKRMYDAAPVVLPLNRVPALRPPAEGGEQQSFTGVVAARIRETGCDYAQAADWAAGEFPELYEAHRSAVTGRA